MQIIIYNDENQNENAAQELRELIINYDNNNKYDCIRCEADFGLWYGRRKAAKHFKTLQDAFYTCIYDSNVVYFDKTNTTLKLKAVHHDGTNFYKFYKIINNKKRAIKIKSFLN